MYRHPSLSTTAREPCLSCPGDISNDWEEEADEMMSVAFKFDDFRGRAPRDRTLSSGRFYEGLGLFSLAAFSSLHDTNVLPSSVLVFTQTTWHNKSCFIWGSHCSNDSCLLAIENAKPMSTVDYTCEDIQITRQRLGPSKQKLKAYHSLRSIEGTQGAGLTTSYPLVPVSPDCDAPSVRFEPPNPGGHESRVWLLSRQSYL